MVAISLMPLKGSVFPDGCAFQPSLVVLDALSCSNREKEEDKEMADFLKSKFPQSTKKRGNAGRLCSVSPAEHTALPLSEVHSHVRMRGRGAGEH